MLLLLASAFAATVAVLPLQEGGGASYAGLGRALSGMLTSDLAAAPGLTLVERAQLDALTTEMKLAESGFLDPATAQRLGKGLGAEFVVLGGYSVVADTFLLDARLVKVETGEVVRAASASGPVAGFVAVEKELVTGLLDGLQVKLAESARAKILAAAPTRDFDAFAAYGEGLSLQASGKLPEAQARFGEALAADPDFKAAADSLVGLRGALDDAAAARKQKTAAKRAAMLDALLVALPEPTRRLDRSSRAALVLRLLALRDQGRDCQRYEEMRRQLDLNDWKLALPGQGYGQLVSDATALAVKHGYAPAPDVDAGGHRDVEFRIQTEGGPGFGSVGRWLYNFPSMLLDVPSSADMLTTMTRCYSVPEQLAELGRLREAVVAKGLGEEQVFGYPVGLAERLEWSALAVRARSTGVSPEMAARIGELVAAHDDTTPLKSTGGSTARAWVESQAQQVVQAGMGVERARAARLGFRPAELKAAIAAVASGDAARVAVNDPDCAGALAAQKYVMAAWVDREPYPGIAASLAPLRDLGCLVGTPARFDTLAQAADWVRTAPSRAKVPSDACTEAFAALPSRVPSPADTNATTVPTSLTWYYATLVMPLCVSDPAVP